MNSIVPRLPTEMLQNIYLLSDIDTKCRLNKAFGLYFFKRSRVLYPIFFVKFVKKNSDVIHNRNSVINQLKSLF